MANVMFKRGSHADLVAKVQGNAKDGVFYLTTDTHRLYVGGANNELTELNKSITEVAAVANLPKENVAKGQFYYCISENILAYYNGTSWGQINPDTTLIEKPQDTTVETVSGKATVAHTVTDSKQHNSKGSFSITGDDAVTVSSIDNDITVTAHDTKYTLSAADATAGDVTGANIVLASDVSGEEDQLVKIYAGTNIAVEKDENGIKISADAAANMYNTGVSEGYDENGKHTVTVIDGDGAKTTDGVTPTIKYGKDKDSSAVFKASYTTDDQGVKTYSNTPELELDVYTTAEVDKIVQAADALHYRGTVSDTDAATKLVITNAQLGDVYKAATTINVAGVNAKTGDLIIAYGEENEDGTLVAESSHWEVIPSGDDQLIAVAAADNKLSITDNGSTIGSIEVVANGENIKTESTAANGDLKVIVQHDVAGAAVNEVAGSIEEVTQAAKSDAEFTALTSISYDANGHIVEVETAKLAVTDTHNELNSVVMSSEAEDGKVTVTTSVAMSDGAKEGSLEITSKSITLAQGENGFSAELEWGTF